MSTAAPALAALYRPQNLADALRVGHYEDEVALRAGQPAGKPPRVRPEGVDPAITIEALRRVNREKGDEIDRLRERAGLLESQRQLLHRERDEARARAVDLEGQRQTDAAEIARLRAIIQGRG
jgi:hypothetical protein